MSTATGSDGLLKVGEHCAFSECHKLDFLPFVCPECQLKYCLDHRTSSAHRCAGQTKTSAARPAGAQRVGGDPRAVKCCEASCKQMVNTATMPATRCPDCRKLTCLRHRQDHHCQPAPAATRSTDSAAEAARGALAKLRMWTASKSASESARSPGSAGSGPGSAGSGNGISTKAMLGFRSSKAASMAARAKAMASLKQNARGETSIAPPNRVYVYVESEHARATSPSGGKDRAEMFFGKDWVVGRVLDKAAVRLQISNLNSMKAADEDRLRVFHVDGGKVLEFSDRLGNAGVRDGDTLVIVKGVRIPSLLGEEA
ncbi:uncharacterized protein V1510DRAFT_415147 [Dipodascopsis tothii]|uniref:uncharacterized protein n=1 Tax=Dipodascopsis tothii TaxID=44089 RepID=UPI0034D00724